MSDKTLMAVILIDPHLVAELLHLPAGAEVVHIDVDHERRGCLKVVLRGVGWPTPPGNLIQVCQPSEAAISTVVASIDWGLPK